MFLYVGFCGFRVIKVWESYRISGGFGYGYGFDVELTEVPGIIVVRAHRTHRSSRRAQKMLYPYPGYCVTGRTELIEVPGMNVLENSQKCRVRV